MTRQQYDDVKTAYDEARARYDQLQRSRQSTTLGRDEQSHRLEQNEAMPRWQTLRRNVARQLRL